MKKTTPTTKSSSKLKLNRETIQSLQDPELQEVAGGSTYRCHSGGISLCSAC
ncbi:MAG TPA: class I lanthipeptide [Thermoanaerobaculia bacterium]|nr:class I lanthipeptide [Thermoanaerobaculia bacterium]